MVVIRGKEFEGVVKVKGVKCMVMEEDLPLGSEHTMQYTDDVSKNFILETYIIILTVIQINLIKK